MQKDPLVTNFSIKAFMSDQTNAVKVDNASKNHIVNSFSFYLILILLVMNNLCILFIEYSYCNLFSPHNYLKNLSVQSGKTFTFHRRK